jgi:hypothetical protein
MDDAVRLDAEQRQELDALRLLANLQRSPTWKKVETLLRERRDVLEDQLGRTGLTGDDRAMLHGKLALCVELLLFLPRSIVDRELADRSPSPEEDVLESSLPDPVRRPDLF